MSLMERRPRPACRPGPKGPPMSMSQRTLSAAALVCALWSAAAAQTVDRKLWVPNQTVDSSARHGNTVYIAGIFTSVGPYTGSGVSLNAATGIRQAGFPEVIGTVRDAVSDGAGGWFIGGDFTEVGGQARVNLAHVGADLAVRPWNPGTNAVVQVLLRQGSTLYVGGQFSILAGVARSRIGAVDTGTGAARAFNPGANSTVYALAGDGTRLFAGGIFTVAGGAARSNFAAFDPVTGALLPLTADTNGLVYDLAVQGNSLYMCGEFTTVAAAAHAKLAEINLGTDTVTAWSAGSISGSVFCLAVDAATVYAGGSFSLIGGQFRSKMAALDRATGLASAFDPNFTGNQVNDIALGSGVVYAGGDFSHAGASVPRDHLAAFAPSDGALLPFDPLASKAVWAIELDGNGMLFAGGAFRSVNGVRRAGLAGLDIVTGEATPFALSMIGGPQSVMVADDELYLTGADLYIDGIPRGCVVRYDLPSHTLSAFNAGSANGSVDVLVADGNTLYAGGGFTTVAGVARERLAAFDRGTGALKAFAPGASNTVRTMILNGSTLYVGGDFFTLGGVARNRLGAVDAATGALLPFDPNAFATVRTLAIDGGKLYVGGDFQLIGGQSRWRLAAFDLATGGILPWNPVASATVNRLVATAGTVFAGGQFTSLDNGAVPRRFLAAINGTTGVASAWDAAIDGSVVSLLHSGGRLYVGGGILKTGGVGRGHFASVGDGLVVADVRPDLLGSGIALRATNPFTHAGAFWLTLPQAARVQAAVYDLRGHRVATLLEPTTLEAGEHRLALGDRDLSSGVYFVRAEVGGRTSTAKFVVVR